ncbi:MAG: NAD(P)/FAD-dependent oxidoreductase [Methanobacteriaceae archaeon]|nr:NAD(P)/FAD-dependent oxidoreductase [Methanobacteriaceae archaeon]
MIETDILIIGAGIAGSAAAIKSSKNGANTILIDRKSELGTPKRCAEGIPESKMKKLELEINPRWITQKITAARIVSPDNTAATFYTQDLKTPETGYILERKVFDKHLTMQAIRNGTKTYLRTEPTKIERIDKDNIIVTLKQENKTFQIKTHIIIAADGPESLIARKFGLNTQTKLENMETGIQFEMTNLPLTNSNSIDFYFGDYAPGGYAWIFPKGDDIANVGLEILPHLAKKSAYEYLNDFIELCPEVKDGQIVEINAGGNPVGGIIHEVITDNLLVVGDAAGCINPVTGGGIDTGIESGYEAGLTAAKAIKDKDYSKNNLKEYEEFIDKGMRMKFKKVLKIKKFINESTDDELNNYAKIMQETSVENVSLQGILKALLKKSPKTLFKLRKLI